jgi:hypothetical protein
MAMLPSSPLAAAPVLLMARLAVLVALPLLAPLELHKRSLGRVLKTRLLETWFLVNVLQRTATAHLSAAIVRH